MSESLADRLRHLESRLAAACSRSGRNRDTVVLIAVSKQQPLALLREAVAAGIRVFGENQVQEAVAKSAELPVDLDWQLIGTLQSNKIKPAARLFSAIHSLDRLKIVRLLAAEAGRIQRVLQGFIQVHLGDEATKHGFPAVGLAEAVRPLADLEWLRVVGLMALPPYADNPEDSRPWFRQLRELRDELQARPEWRHFPGYLSMGMSHDFEVAIEEGATHVRVGTALFGPRQRGGG